MSLINQMLQDLDSRRAVNGPKSGLPNEVRPLPPARRSHAPLIAAVSVAVLAVVGVSVWQLSDPHGTPDKAERRLATSPVATQAVPDAVVAPGLPSSPVVSLPSGGTETAGVASLSSPISADDDEARLRLTTSLRLLPEREPSPPPRATVPAAPRASAAASSASPGPAAAPLAPAVASRPNGPALIEKSAASGSPRERAEGEYRKALGVLNAGRLGEAIEGLRAALRQEGTHAASRQLLFKLLIENKRLDEAAELLQEGLQLQPAQISWAMSLARLQVDRGDLPGALQTLQRSSPSAANSADYQGFLAHVLQRLGRSREAVESYQSATRLAPGEGRWWLGLGLALEADGRAAEARDALLRAKASGTLGGELSALVEQKLR